MGSLLLALGATVDRGRLGPWKGGLSRVVGCKRIATVRAADGANARLFMPGPGTVARGGASARMAIERHPVAR
jgi:hypothetical protein